MFKKLLSTTAFGTPRMDFGTLPSSRFPLCGSPGTIPRSYESDIPFAPNYKYVPGLISNCTFSRINILHGHTSGYMAFLWGLNVTVQSVRSLKHTRNNKVMADTVFAYTRASTFIAEDTSSPITAVTWYQTWDPSGNNSLVFSLNTAFHNAYIE